MTLAQRAPGQVTGLDLFPDFIRIFNRNARALGLSDRVKGIVGSMDDLPFGKESLDLIWSEGAIYNIGFERGLKEWRDYLKTADISPFPNVRGLPPNAPPKSTTSGWRIIPK